MTSTQRSGSGRCAGPTLASPAALSRSDGLGCCGQGQQSAALLEGSNQLATPTPVTQHHSFNTQHCYNTATAHPLIQHTHSYNTPTHTTHPPIQHTHSYNIPTHTTMLQHFNNIPTQHIHTQNTHFYNT